MSKSLRAFIYSLMLASLSISMSSCSDTNTSNTRAHQSTTIKLLSISRVKSFVDSRSGDKYIAPEGSDILLIKFEIDALKAPSNIDVEIARPKLETIDGSPTRTSISFYKFSPGQRLSKEVWFFVNQGAHPKTLTLGEADFDLTGAKIE